MSSKPRIKVTTTGTPPLSGAEAFARLMVESMSKRPELKVVAARSEAAEGPAPKARHRTQVRARFQLGENSDF